MPYPFIATSSIRKITGVLVFLFFGLYFALRSGYSVAALGLLLVSLLLWTKTIRFRELPQALRTIMWVWVLYVAYRVARDLLDGAGVSSLDVPVKLLLSMPALLLLMKFRPGFPAIRWGVWCGCYIACAVSGIDLLNGEERGFADQGIIQTGNASMLFGLLALCLSLPLIRDRSWQALPGLLAALAGALGSLFSLSRGGWIFTPVVLAVISYYAVQWVNWKSLMSLWLVIIVAVGAMVFHSGVREFTRIDQAFTEITDYSADQPDEITSVGLRLDFWRAAARASVRKPVFGWGREGLNTPFSEYVAEGWAPSRIVGDEHMHNDYLNELAIRGTVGLLIYLAMLILPLRWFLQNMLAARNENDESRQVVCLCGVVTLLSIFGFALTHAYMQHNSGVLVYGFLLSILFSAGSGELPERSQAIA